MSSQGESTSASAAGKTRGLGLVLGLFGVLWLAYFITAQYRSGQFGFAWVLLSPQEYWAGDWGRHLLWDLPGVLGIAVGSLMFAKSLLLRVGLLLFGLLGATLLPEFWCGIQDLRFRSEVRGDLENARSADRWWPNPNGERLYFKPGRPIQVRDSADRP